MSETTITEQEYRRLKQDVERSQAEAQRAKGALDQLMVQLEQEFHCTTLKEAKALLVELEAKRDRSQQRYEEAVKTYEKKWKRSNE